MFLLNSRLLKCGIAALKRTIFLPTTCVYGSGVGFSRFESKFKLSFCAYPIIPYLKKFLNIPLKSARRALFLGVFYFYLSLVTRPILDTVLQKTVCHYQVQTVKYLYYMSSKKSMAGLLNLHKRASILMIHCNLRHIRRSVMAHQCWRVATNSFT